MENVVNFLNSLTKKDRRLGYTINTHNASKTLVNSAFVLRLDAEQELSGNHIKVRVRRKSIEVAGENFEIVFQKHNATLYNFINVLNLSDEVNIANNEIFKQIKITANY